jgi:hypothetical protein
MKRQKNRHNSESLRWIAKKILRVRLRPSRLRGDSVCQASQSNEPCIGHHLPDQSSLLSFYASRIHRPSSFSCLQLINERFVTWQRHGVQSGLTITQRVESRSEAGRDDICTCRSIPSCIRPTENTAVVAVATVGDATLVFSSLRDDAAPAGLPNDRDWPSLAPTSRCQASRSIRDDPVWPMSNVILMSSRSVWLVSKMSRLTGPAKWAPKSKTRPRS